MEAYSGSSQRVRCCCTLDRSQVASLHATAITPAAIWTLHMGVFRNERHQAHNTVCVRVTFCLDPCDGLLFQRLHHGDVFPLKRTKVSLRHLGGDLCDCVDDRLLFHGVTDQRKFRSSDTGASHLGMPCDNLRTGTQPYRSYMFRERVWIVGLWPFSPCGIHSKVPDTLKFQRCDELRTTTISYGRSSGLDLCDLVQDPRSRRSARMFYRRRIPSCVWPPTRGRIVAFLRLNIP